MEIVPFTDQYDVAAALYGRSPEELRSRDAQADRVDRWMANRNGAAIAAVTTWQRPDDREFLHLVGDAGAFGPLGAAAGESLGRSVYAVVDVGKSKE